MCADQTSPGRWRVPPIHISSPFTVAARACKASTKRVIRAWSHRASWSECSTRGERAEIMIAAFDGIEELDMSEGSRLHTVDDTGSMAIGDMLEKNTSLKELKFTCARTSGSLAHISRGLSNNSTLTSLTIQRQGARGSLVDCFINVSAMLKSNSTLKVLDLSKYWITDYGMTSIAKSLKNNSSLVTLRVQGQFGRKAMKSIAGMLEVNTTLRTLDFRGIVDDNTHLVDSMKANITITDISFENMDAPESDLDGYLERNRALSAPGRRTKAARAS